MMIKKAMLVVLVSGVALSAAACNTVKGAGKDLQSASDTTKKEINK